MEQTLGHVTHARNLRDAMKREDIAATWLPIAFAVRGIGRFVPVYRSNWSFRASFQAYRALTRTLKTVPQDLLFFHTQTTALFAHHVKPTTPFVISLDATPLNYDSIGRHYGHRPADARLLDRRKRELHRTAFQRATAIVAWSEWVRDSLVTDYGVDPARVAIVRPSAATSFFQLGERREFRSGARPLRVLFVGANFARKGGDVLLEAIAPLLGADVELDLVTQADVPARRGIFVHRGLAPNSPEMLRLYESADIFVLPTFADATALAVIEAMASGLPIITTNVGAQPESVGDAAITVAPGNAALLSDALRLLVSNPGLREASGARARARAQRLFSPANYRLLLGGLVATAEGAGRQGAPPSLRAEAVPSIAQHFLNPR